MGRSTPYGRGVRDGSLREAYQACRETGSTMRPIYPPALTRLLPLTAVTIRAQIHERAAATAATGGSKMRNASTRVIFKPQQHRI